MERFIFGMASGLPPDRSLAGLRAEGTSVLAGTDRKPTLGVDSISLHWSQE
jgi:hypothetical protein